MLFFFFFGQLASCIQKVMLHLTVPDRQKLMIFGDLLLQTTVLGKLIQINSQCTMGYVIGGRHVGLMVSV